MGELTGRAVVTGAASGIGRALAATLVRRGTPVAAYCTGALFTVDGGFTLGIPVPH